MRQRRHAPVASAVSKVCTKCGWTKLEEDFYERKGRYRGSGKRASWCKMCSDLSSKNISKKKRRDNKLEAIKLLGGACVVCGYDAHPAALDFHHQDGTKDFGIGENLRGGVDRIRAEIDKCTLLCSNCHRVEHTDWEV